MNILQEILSSNQRQIEQAKLHIFLEEKLLKNKQKNRVML